MEKVLEEAKKNVTKQRNKRKMPDLSGNGQE